MSQSDVADQKQQQQQQQQRNITRKLHEKIDGRHVHFVHYYFSPSVHVRISSATGGSELMSKEKTKKQNLKPPYEQNAWTPYQMFQYNPLSSILRGPGKVGRQVRALLGPVSSASAAVTLAIKVDRNRLWVIRVEVL